MGDSWRSDKPCRKHGSLGRGSQRHALDPAPVTITTKSHSVTLQIHSRETTPKGEEQWTRVPKGQQPRFILSTELCRHPSLVRKGTWDKPRLHASQGHKTHKWQNPSNTPQTAGSFCHEHTEATNVIQFRE